MNPTKDCPICGESFVIRDIRNPQATCGKRVCITNHKFAKANYNPRTGETRTPWKNP